MCTVQVLILVPVSGDGQCPLVGPARSSASAAGCLLSPPLFPFVHLRDPCVCRGGIREDLEDFVYKGSSLRAQGGALISRGFMCSSGSSLRVQGRRLHDVLFDVLVGFIPAHAG